MQIVTCGVFCVAVKQRRRRPTTSSPLRKGNNEDSESSISPKTGAVQKTFSIENKQREIASSGDQIHAPSVNRFRVRSKPKLDLATKADNSSDFGVQTDKSSKDGYKVNAMI